MSPHTTILVLCIILGVVILIVGLGARLYRSGGNRPDKHQQLFLDSGFQEAPERTDDLTGRMKTLHHQWTEFHRLDGVKRKSEWGYDLFVFDLRDSGGHTTGIQPDQALILSPDFKLPRFTMFPFPKVQGTGFLASMENMAASYISSKIGVQVPFPDFPEFDKRYLVCGDDEGGVRACFSASRLGRLAGMQGLHLEGRADALLYSGSLDGQAGRAEPGNPGDLLQTAKTLFDIFKE